MSWGQPWQNPEALRLVWTAWEYPLTLRSGCLADEPGALNLWQFIALFSGNDEEVLDLWEEISGDLNARVTIADHFLFSFSDGGIFMLPPIARYALDQS